ncbi:MAG: YidC/Oxa1 family insertase periplasmic-domain containing protein, partial [bacterium]
MDRKNFFLGIACIAAAMFIFAVSRPTAQPAGASATVVASAQVVVPTIATVKSSSSSIRELAASDAEKAVLENGVVRVTFSTRGGAIEQVELLHQPANLERKSNIIFNAGNGDAAMALGILNSTNNRVEPVYSEFRRVDLPASATPSIAFQGTLPDGTKVLRTYALSAADKEGAEPYSIRFSTKVTPSSAGQMPTRVWHSTGSWQHTESDSTHQFLSVLADNGEDLTHVNINVFKDSS